VHEEEEEAI